MRHPNWSTALARVVMDELARNRVTHVVIAPGSRSAALAIAAHSEPGLEVVVALDERSAGFWAVGFGKATGLPAAVVVTSGTAVANLVPAVVEADMALVPMIVLSANRPPELRQVGANQTIEQVGLFGSKVRWAAEIAVAEDRDGSNSFWRSTVCRAVSTAAGQGGSPGPVHVDLGFREPLVPMTNDGRTAGAEFVSETEGRWDGRPWTEVLVPAPGVPVMPLPDEFRQEAGLVVVGDTRFAEAAGLLAHNEGWPLIAEPPSSQRGGIGIGLDDGSEGRAAITTAHHLVGSEVFREAMPPDLIVRFGRANLSRSVDAYIGAAARKVVVDLDGWADPSHEADHVLRAVPISTRYEPPPPSVWLTEWQRLDAAIRRVVDGVLDRLDLPTEPRAARDVARAVPEFGTLIVASSMPVRDLNMFMEGKRMEVYANRGASGIDGFVSMALGVAASVSEPPVALAGDLSILHDSNGFLTKPRGDCVFVVVNNDGGGIFSFLPQAGTDIPFEALFGTPHAKSFALLAGFHGLGHTEITSAADLIPAIAAARESSGVHLIEIRTDRNANVELHRGIEEGVANAIQQLIR